MGLSPFERVGNDINAGLDVLTCLLAWFEELVTWRQIPSAWLI